jgi:hemerythrin superfamily protein
MNALDILIADHRKLQKLMTQVEETSERASAKRMKLFGEIKLNATVHEKAEEKYLYPYLLDIKKYRPDALEHREEVKIMSRLLKELSTEISSEDWKAKFTVLKELTDNHIEEEENEFFPEISKLLSDQDLEKIGNQILEYKEKNLK